MSVNPFIFAKQVKREVFAWKKDHRVPAQDLVMICHPELLMTLEMEEVLTAGKDDAGNPTWSVCGVQVVECAPADSERQWLILRRVDLPASLLVPHKEGA